MRRWMPRGVFLSLLVFGVVAAGVWVASQIVVRAFLRAPAQELANAADAVALLRIQGGIFDARATIKLLGRLKKRPGIKALVLRIESPGGAVAPTQEIYEELLRLKRSGLKVVASLGSVAASGGYYLAVAADKIIANPGSITGSIGVVMVLPNVTKMLGNVGLQVNVIKSGPNKDLASPFRPLGDREREILQRLVDDTYGQFVRAVSSGRKLPREKVLPLADGRIFSGERARELGLVDALGTERDAMLEAARLGGIKGEPRVIELEAEVGLWSLLRQMSRSWAGWLGLDNMRFWGDTPAVLEYMWRVS